MSDHISGPRALAEPIADITDVYAFPSPERPGNVVLVMNTLPFAQPSDNHSEGLIYRFRVRPLTMGAANDLVPFVVDGGEFKFDCVFSAPSSPTGGGVVEQEGTCTTPSGDTVPFRVNDEQGDSADGVRVFAGPRWDPFMMDAPAALATIATGKLAFNSPGSIYLDGKNVLGLVVEVDAALLEGAEMVGPKQHDQVNRDLEIRDIYNTEDAFALGESYTGAYRARLNANLAYWDGIDGKTDWVADANDDHPLTNLVLADYLAVDLTKPYVERGSFLEIELAARRGERHQTCGGRTLNDDVMDTIFTQLINAGNGPIISDGVDQSTRPAASTFPYLSAPNPDPPAMPPPHSH